MLPDLPDEVPDYMADVDLVGLPDPGLRHLLEQAIDLVGEELVEEEDFNRWFTVVTFPEDGRSQRVRLFLEQPGERSAAYLGPGMVLLTATSNVGPDTSIVDAFGLYRRAGGMYLTRLVSEPVTVGNVLRVRGSIPYAAATPQNVAALLSEAAAFGDMLEEMIYGAGAGDMDAD